MHNVEPFSKLHKIMYLSDAELRHAVSEVSFWDSQYFVKIQHLSALYCFYYFKNE